MIGALSLVLPVAFAEGQLTDPIHLVKVLIELTVFSVILYIALRFLRETRGSGVVRGLALLLLVGVTAFLILIQTLHLDRLKLLFETIAQSVVIGLVVVFHPEIRRAIVHLGDAPIFGRFFRTDNKIVPRLLRAVARMSKERIGALIAIEREASLTEVTENGITIDAELNSYLIESIFFPKSALHDGGVVVRDDRIVAASCLFPLSQNPDVDKRLGTRHRAALGLSEDTDALVLVVSEETGKISTATGGKLNFDLSLEQLEQQLGDLQGGGTKTPEKRRRLGLWATLFADPYRKLAAAALAIGLWLFLNNQITLTIPRPLRLEAIGPQRVAGTVFSSRLAVVLPTDQVVGLRFLDGGNEISGVTITLSGPRYRVEALKDAPMDLQITTFLTQDWANVKSVDFSTSDITRNLSALEGVHLEMQPSRVTLEVGKLDDRSVPLNLDQVDLLNDEILTPRLRRDTASFSPDVARLLGPASSLAQFPAKGAKPLQARLRLPRGNERQLTAILELTAPAELGLRLAETPSMTIQVLPVTQVYELDLPLRVDDLALPPDLRGLYRPVNMVQRVRIRAGGELQSKLVSLSDDKGGDRRQLTEWASAYLRLDVWIPPLEPGATYGTELVREARLFLRGPMQASVDRTECELDKPVSILLRRNP